MVIVLKKGATVEEKQKIKEFLQEKNFKTNEIAGQEETIIAAVGKMAIDPRTVELLGGVQRVIPISKPYKMASREFKKEDTIVEIANNRGQIIRIGGKRLACIAGPCAVESTEQMMAVAKKVQEAGAVMLRGGAYKPRTSPYSFQGLGEEGCKILKEAGDKYGLPVVSEIVAAEYLSIMKDYIDVLQIGARNMQNFELLKKVGASGKPVILKRGISATLEEWLMAAEYLLSSGAKDVILCERGIRTYERATRNTLDLSCIPILRSLTHLPIIVDPSHAVGIRDKVSPMGLAAVAAGADGIIVEVHCNPDKALSDGAQSLYPQQFQKLMHDIEAMAPVLEKQVAHIRQNVAQEAKKMQNIDKKTAFLTCAYSGKRGAFAEQAVFSYFDDTAKPVTVDSFKQIFQNVVDKKADYGMVPIENSLAGSVYENYDNLTRFEDISVCGAVTLRIRHCLLAVKGTTLSSLKSVYSHPQPFLQCSKFLEQHKNWTHIDSVSTATAASIVAKKGTKDNAAIASSINAKYYGLEILEEGIEDDPRNFTRFLVIRANNTKDKEQAQQKTGQENMASFVFTVSNTPGALYKCLGVFQKHSLNLTRLESRPVPGEPWKYFFYADASLFDIKEDKTSYVQKVMQDLKETAQDIRLLGVYKEEGI